MEQKPVSKLEIISDLEDIIEEIRSGKYSLIALFQSIMVSERKISDSVSETYQTGKHVIIKLGNNDGS